MVNSSTAARRARTWRKVCDWGDSVTVEVVIPAHLSFTGKSRSVAVEIDACISNLVRALNASGIYTANSCCGHGLGLGSIILHDGTELFIRRVGQ